MRSRWLHFTVLGPLALSFGLSSVGHAQTASRAAQAGQAAQSAALAPSSNGNRVALSLARANERFRSENFKLMAARYEISSARADVIAAGLLPNPNLSLGAGLKVRGTSQGADRELSIGLSQALPLSGRLGLRQDAAQLTASATEREFAAVTWSLFGDLRQAYLGLQVAQQRRSVLEAGLTDLDRVQRVLQERTAAGANPAYDRVRLEVERGSLRARLAQVGVAVLEARAELAASIGGAAEPSELQASDALSEPALEGQDLSSLLRLAQQHRHEIAASQLSAQAAEARARAIKRSFAPDPEIGVGYSHWFDVPGAPGSGGALLLSASIPLPVFDHGQGTVERQLEQGKLSRVLERDALHGIEREVMLALERQRLSASSYLRYRAESEKDAESVRKIAEISYREGRGTILELLDAYASYLRVQEQALDLRAAALAAEISLRQAVGQ